MNIQEFLFKATVKEVCDAELTYCSSEVSEEDSDTCQLDGQLLLLPQVHASVDYMVRQDSSLMMNTGRGGGGAQPQKLHSGSFCGTF